jgi:hypothetical protein
MLNGGNSSLKAGPASVCYLLLNGREDLLRGIYSYGFEKPSAVTQRAIHPIRQRRHCAESSWHWQGVFSVGAIQFLDLSLREPQVLILSPSRELAELRRRSPQPLGTTSMSKSMPALEARVSQMTYAALTMEYTLSQALLAASST